MDSINMTDSAARKVGELIAKAFTELGGAGPVIDAGCGTGLVADHLPAEITVDGVDLSPDMLELAEKKGRYRSLLEADLTKPLPFGDGAYAGMTCAGTFTQGHVGPEALDELLRVLKPGAVCAISGKPPFYDTAGFPENFLALASAGQITSPATAAKSERSTSSPTPPQATSTRARKAARIARW